ncbi:MAG: PaaI family thioesterase [Alphaproteobacteria bacterium]|nr:PaaI family thioesterase [Alphaproteobacteria bacterium]
MTDDLIEENLPEIPPGYERMNWFQGFGRQIGPLYEKYDGAGDYTRAFLVGEHHTNGMRNCHGGMLMAFADMAFGHAISIGTHRFWVTVRLVTDFLASAKVGDWVEGTGEIVGAEADLYTVRGRIWVKDQTIMTGSGVFKALGERPVRQSWPKHLRKT